MKSKYYVFEKTDKGVIGKAFEMAIKSALNRPNADTVSPAGKPDFRYSRKCYDVKQNSSVIKYDMNDKTYIKGSKRVIYATHVVCDVINEGDSVKVSVDLQNTKMYLLDRNEFVDFLLTTGGMVRVNAKRNTVSIQTVYNYAKQAYHGHKGMVIEQWCEDHEIMDTDNIIGQIMSAGL